MKAIQTSDISPEGKIRIAEFICNDLSDIYRLPYDRHEVIVNELTDAIYEGEDIPIPLRLFYLKFRNKTVPYHVSVNLFHNGIREKMRIIPYFQILKYILRANLDIRKETHCQEVLDEFEQLFDNEDISIYTKMEIADIFILNGRTERGNEMMDLLREMEFNLVLNSNDANNTALNKRIEIDTSRFTHKKNSFCLNDVFSSLWAFINRHPSREELYKRLIE